METSLASLTSNILDAILSLDGMSSCALRLWMSGSSNLRYKLATGLTRIHLANPQRFSTNRWPSILANLRALRELSIDRDYYTLLRHNQIGSEVQKLSPTLRKLKLRILESRNILTPSVHSQLEALSINKSEAKEGELRKTLWTFKAAFPHLESLDLHSKEKWLERDFELLPPSLTHLNLRHLPKVTDIGKFASLIPRQLLSLNVANYVLNASFWVNLPPNLTALKVECALRDHDGVSYADIAKGLPRTLTSITLPFGHFSPAELALLPPSLTEIDTYERTSSSSASETTLDLDVGRHFPNLRAFHTSVLSPTLLRSLPSGITSIQAHVNDDTIKPEHWPSSLVSLEIRDAASNFSLSILPPGLTEFAILYEFELDLASVSLLPRSLRTLECHNGLLRDKADFPPTLTTLSFARCENALSRWLVFEEAAVARPSMPEEDEEAAEDREPDLESAAYRETLNGRKVLRCFPFHCLPQSLTELKAELFLPASKLKHLPRRLKLLNIDDIFEDADFHPDSAEELDAMRSIFDVGRREGFEENFDWTQLKQASILLLLPRTLKSLSLWGDATNARVDWSHLPPRLLSIWLHPQKGLPADFIYQTPLKHTARLHVQVDRPTDEHIKAIPRHLAGLRIDVTDDSLLTRKASLFYPAGPVLYGELCNERLDGIYQELNTKRKQHAQDDDPSLYLRLISCDESVLDMLPKAVESSSSESGSAI